MTTICSIAVARIVDNHMKYFGSFMFLIIICITSSRGAMPVKLSPFGIAPICHGGQLELMCTTTGGFLEWDIYQILENGTVAVNLGGRLFNNRPSQTSSYRLINSVFFNFSRVSPPGALPLISRLQISPALSSVNGTEVVCEDSITSISLSTIIYIVTEDLIQDHPTVNFTWTLEQPESDRTNVTLVWNMSVNPVFFYYHINITPEASYTFAETSITIIEVLLDYIPYNVSIVATHICGRAMPVILNAGLFYPDCGGQASVGLLEVIDYLNPTQNRNITLRACPPALDPIETGCTVNRWGNDAVMLALVASVSTFILTLIFTFIIGFGCGVYFIKKRKKLKATGSPPHGLYEEVLSTDTKQREKALELKQNAAYAPISVN